jgi:hypothetical protein
MADVRIDANGIPKGEVWEQAVPVEHRSNVTAADGADPDADEGIDADGYEAIDFDLDVTLGGTNPMVEVAPLFYDATADAWFRGGSSFFTATGRYRVRAASRGARTFLSVVALSGTTPTLSLDCWATLT